MYTISRKFSRDVLLTAFHKHNFPSTNAIVAICKFKMLIVSPFCRSPEEKKNQYYITTDHGAIVIHDSSDESVHSTSCVKRKLDYSSYLLTDSSDIASDVAEDSHIDKALKLTSTPP